MLLLCGTVTDEYSSCHLTICIAQKASFPCTPVRQDCFEQMRTMIHFVDSLREDHSKSLRKFEALLKILCTHYRTVFIPETHINN